MTFSIGEKIGVGKKVSTIAMLGPLLAMPSGQGLNMTLLAILKVNRANWLLVLEKNWSCGKMFLLLTRYHYWSDNIMKKENGSPASSWQWQLQNIVNTTLWRQSLEKKGVFSEGRTWRRSLVYFWVYHINIWWVFFLTAVLNLLGRWTVLFGKRLRMVKPMKSGPTSKHGGSMRYIGV